VLTFGRLSALQEGWVAVDGETAVSAKLEKSAHPVDLATAMSEEDPDRRARLMAEAGVDEEAK
jgi:hypothetical protein